MPALVRAEPSLSATRFEKHGCSPSIYNFHNALATNDSARGVDVRFNSHACVRKILSFVDFSKRSVILRRGKEVPVSNIISLPVTGALQPRSQICQQPSPLTAVETIGRCGGAFRLELRLWILGLTVSMSNTTDRHGLCDLHQGMPVVRHCTHGIFVRGPTPSPQFRCLSRPTPSESYSFVHKADSGCEIQNSPPIAGLRHGTFRLKMLPFS